MKRTMTLLLILLAGGLLLTACGKDEQPADTADGQAQAQAQAQAGKAEEQAEQKKTAEAEQTLQDIQDQALGKDQPAKEPQPDEKTKTDVAKAAEQAGDEVKKAAKQAAETGDAKAAAEDLKKKATEEAKDADDASGAMKGPWHNARKGTRLKYKNFGGTFMVFEVVKADPEKVTVQMTTLNAANKPLGQPIEQVHPRQIKPDSKEAEKQKQYLSNKKGTETVQVAGKQYKCDVYETTSTFGDKKIKTRMYMCKDIPGWLVKTQSDSTGEMQTQQELMEIKQ